MKQVIWLAICSLLVLFFFLGLPNEGKSAGNWIVETTANELRISYGSGVDYPQYAALHLDSSYFRPIYGSSANWGASVILFPPFWSNTTYHQGTPITATWQVIGQDLVLSILGTHSTLTMLSEMRISPPTDNMLTAQVTTAILGNLALDTNRPGEVFKPVMLSSMHISSTKWDTQSAYAASLIFPIPSSGWIVSPPVFAQVFGLKGGTSETKINAPTVEISLDTSMSITGWVTYSNNTNDDNIGYWAATDTILHAYRYTIIAKPEPQSTKVSNWLSY